MVVAGRRRSTSRLDPPPMSVSLHTLRHLMNTCLRPSAVRATSHFRGPNSEAASRGGQFALIRDTFD